MSSATIRPLGPDPATVARSILRSAASRRANGVTLIPFDSAAGPKLCSGVCTALKGSSALLTATGALTTGAGADAGEAATGAKAGFTADMAAGDDAERKSDGEGKREYARVKLGGWRIIKNKKNNKTNIST